MKKNSIPEGYQSSLNLRDTQEAIMITKNFFQKELADALNLCRVTAPLFVDPVTGLNDNLNGFEEPVSFYVKDCDGTKAEIVQSLAKWKRFALGEYDFKVGEGLYTDMNAIRKDEITDNIHSIYVDQWDWEKVIRREDRTLDFLKTTMSKIYQVLNITEKYLAIKYKYIEEILPKSIVFVTTDELENLYPNKSRQEREYLITKKYGAVALLKIGGKLKDGKPHDGRAPDYDDWELNGDILVYYPVLDIALELSSMGIRVDGNSLCEQLEISNCNDRKVLPFQKSILENKLPLTIGGGIGQSRLCMFFLRKAHIGEVQSSLWSKELILLTKEKGINLL